MAYLKPKEFYKKKKTNSAKKMYNKRGKQFRKHISIT